MTELVDEVEALQANVEGLRNLSESLKTFNENFASWLYVMDMNALTVDWPQVNSSASYHDDQIYQLISIPLGSNGRIVPVSQTPSRYVMH